MEHERPLGGMAVDREGVPRNRIGAGPVGLHADGDGESDHRGVALVDLVPTGVEDLEIGVVGDRLGQLHLYPAGRLRHVLVLGGIGRLVRGMRVGRARGENEGSENHCNEDGAPAHVQSMSQGMTYARVVFMVSE
jgi:hypothetical protein